MSNLTPVINTSVSGAPPFSYSKHDVIMEVQDLHVSYDVPILSGVSFQVRDIIREGMSQGQVIALLAPSGMGKTQMFRCIAGLQKPTSGHVLLNSGETDKAGLPIPIDTRAGLVGVVSQDYAVFHHLTVEQNVIMAAKLRAGQDAKAVTEKYLTDFGLIEARSRYPHEISGGMRQRLAIIQQAVSCGHLLLMDEPFSGLDVLRKEEVQKLVQGITTTHELNTIFLTTHDIAAAISVSDTILLLGRERNTDGAIIPGAKIRQTFDLAERGLAWRPKIEELPAFRDLEKEIRDWFHNL